MQNMKRWHSGSDSNLYFDFEYKQKFGVEIDIQWRTSTDLELNFIMKNISIDCCFDIASI